MLVDKIYRAIEGLSEKDAKLALNYIGARFLRKEGKLEVWSLFGQEFQLAFF